MRRRIAVLSLVSAAALGAAGAAELDRALARPVDVNFADTPFESAIRYVAKSAGFNVVIDRAALDQKTLRRPIDFRIDGIPAREAVKWLTRLAGAHYEPREKAVVVSSKGKMFRKRVTLKVYNVHDLTSSVPDFPGPGIEPLTMSGYGTPTVISGGETAREITAESIAEYISYSVRPGDWAPELGTSIEERGGRLVIVALPEMHAEIEKRLDHLRKRERRMVTFHVRAVSAPAATVERALAMAAEDGTLPPEALASLRSVVRAEPRRLLASTRFTCMNAQRTHSWSGRQTTYVNDFEISGESYDPVVTTLRRGLRADVRPFSSDDGSSILLELRLGWSDPEGGELVDFRPLGPEEEDEKPDDIPAPGAIQQPRVPLAQLKTTVRLRSGATVALSVSSPVRDLGAGADADEIVFLVTATSVTF